MLNWLNRFLPMASQGDQISRVRDEEFDQTSRDGGILIILT